MENIGNIFYFDWELDLLHWFQSIHNSVLDFIVNYADIDVKGINYPGSDQKPIHNYIIVGAIKNLAVEIENCVVGNVRIGNCIDASERFHKLISDSSDEQYTIIWVNIKADSFTKPSCWGKNN